MAETNARLSENKSNPSNGVLTLDFESGRRTAAVQEAGASHCAWKFAKLLECACPSGARVSLPYQQFGPDSNSCFELYLIRLFQLNQKRQKDSRSPRRYRESLRLEICEAFGVRLSFLALLFRCRITSLGQTRTRVSSCT